MKTYSAIGFLLTLLWALITVPAVPGTAPLQPGGTLTLNCATGNVLTKNSTTATGSQAVAARVTMALDSTGTVLTVNLQNTSTAPDALLYALDLGLPHKFITVNRMEATFSGFPTGARWLGPTDIVGPTNATGTSTLAAREVIGGRMEDYLKPQKSLPPGFLRTGQAGSITVKITLSADARQKPLQLDPVAYFLVNDPKAPNKRIQIASTNGVR